MFRRLPLVVVALVTLALVAAACTDSVEIADPTTTADGAATTDGQASATTDPAGDFELIEPDPDPTPIPAGDDVRIGTLDNGLTYYVRSNEAPGNSLSLRLAVNAGSLQQVEAESGAAHFLEHMLFNGTERFPGNELARALERIGVQFGADLNAYTSFDETVYQLDLVGITDETIATGFDVLADWASAATIEQEATVDERGVVREEIRLRDEGAEGAVATAFNDVYLRGTAYDGREPGGRGDLILETNAEELRAFYERWYRPDLMAVVAVGDLPVDRMEAEIVDRFSDLEAGADGPERTVPTVDPIDEVVADVVTHPELARSFVSIDYSLTSWDQSTVGGERLTLIQELIALVIGNRLQDAVDRGDVELDEPFVTRFDQTRVQSFLGFNFDAPDMAAGIEYVLSEMRRLELSGFTEAELQRAAAEFQTAFDQFLASAPSTQDRAYADRYAGNFLDGSPISSAADTHERWTAALGDITAGEITDVFRWEMSQAAPIVIVVGRTAAELPSVVEIEAAIEAAGVATVADAAEADDADITELMARPEPVEPASSGVVEEVGGREWVYDNGVTVRFVESDIAANQVNLFATADGGWSLLSPNDAALSGFAVAAVADSGIGEHDRLTARRFLAGSTAELFPYIDETSEGFVGAAGTEDLEIMFQRLHLAVTAPRIDDRALAETIDDGEDQRRLAETDAGFATFNALADIRFDGDERFSLTPPSFDSLTSDRALDIYQQRLSTVDDLEVAVVGDVEADVVEELASAYLGTLPGSDADTWTDVRPAAIDEVVRRDVTAGSGDATGTVAVFYPSTVDLDALTRIELLVLERIFGTRLLDVVREELGASYGGSAIVQTAVAPREGVDILLFANIDPARGDEIVDVILAEADDLRTNGPSEDELDRATSVLQGDFDLVGNGDLIEMLLTEPDEEVLTYDRRSTLLAAVTADDIRQLAGTVLPAAVRAEVITVPN